MLTIARSDARALPYLTFIIVLGLVVAAAHFVVESVFARKR